MDDSSSDFEDEPEPAGASPDFDDEPVGDSSPGFTEGVSCEDPPEPPRCVPPPAGFSTYVELPAPSLERRLPLPGPEPPPPGRPP
ncbi:hypothetical protein ABT395_24590, partial [Streptomyces cacaoi]